MKLLLAVLLLLLETTSVYAYTHDELAQIRAITRILKSRLHEVDVGVKVNGEGYVGIETPLTTRLDIDRDTTRLLLRVLHAAGKEEPAE